MRYLFTLNIFFCRHRYNITFFSHFIGSLCRLLIFNKSSEHYSLEPTSINWRSQKVDSELNKCLHSPESNPLAYILYRDIRSQNQRKRQINRKLFDMSENFPLKTIPWRQPHLFLQISAYMKLKLILTNLQKQKTRQRISQWFINQSS